MNPADGPSNAVRELGHRAGAYHAYVGIHVSSLRVRRDGFGAVMAARNRSTC